MSLSTALRVNALFTLTCSLFCLLAGEMLLRHTGIPSMIWVTGLGLMLLSYVPMLLFAAFHPFEWLVKLIILLDWCFVSVATVWLMFSWDRADIIGIVLQAGSISLVAVFAIIQQIGLTSLIKDGQR